MWSCHTANSEGAVVRWPAGHAAYTTRARGRRLSLFSPYLLDGQRMGQAGEAHFDSGSVEDGTVQGVDGRLAGLAGLVLQKDKF